MTKRTIRNSWIPTALVAVAIYFAVSLAKSQGLISDYWYQVIQFAGLTAVSALGLNLIYGFNGQFSLGHIGFYAIGAYGSALITKDFTIKWSGSQFGALSWIIAGQIGIVVFLLVLNRLPIASLRERLRAALSRYLKPYESWVFEALLAIAAGVVTALLLQRVFSPLLNATLAKLPENVAQPIVFALALIMGGTMAAILAYLVGLPLLRLSSDYFGIATLGLAVMVYTALQNSDQVIATMKGARGMVGIPRWSTWGWVLGVLAVIVIIMRNLIYSSHGRAIISVREDEIASRAMGNDVAELKAVAFAAGGLFAGVAGGLYAHLYGFLHPSTFNVVKGFDPLIIIVLGGLGSMTGTVLGALIFALVIEGLRVVLPQGFEDWRFVVYPILLLLIMLLRQRGLLGTTEWGWLRAPLPPVRDIPLPDRSIPGASPAGTTTAAQREEVA
jgi:branched-chain amino acid transport system permease protein